MVSHPIDLIGVRRSCFRGAVMRRTLGSILCGIMLSLVVSLPAMAIDCARAGSRTEKLICATPTLQAIDSAMAKAYGELKSSLPAAHVARQSG